MAKVKKYFFFDIYKQASETRIFVKQSGYEESTYKNSAYEYLCQRLYYNEWSNGQSDSQY